MNFLWLEIILQIYIRNFISFIKILQNFEIAGDLDDQI